MSPKELLCHPGTYRLNQNCFVFKGEMFYLSDDEVAKVHEECLAGLTDFCLDHARPRWYHTFFAAVVSFTFFVLLRSPD